MSPSGQIQIFGGAFQNMEGGALSFGYLIIELSHDENLASVPEQIVGGLKVKVNLDISGNIPLLPPTYLFVNSLITPANSYYIVRGFDQSGTTAFASPQLWTIPASPDPYNVGNIIPASPPGSGLSVSGQITLQTNSVNNSVQNLENLVAGTNITLVNSGGATTISSTSGGASFSTAGSAMFYPGVNLPGAVNLNGNFAANASANTVGVIPLILLASYTIRKISNQVRSGLAANFATCAIYSADGNTKLIDAGANAFNLNSSSTQVVTLGSPVVLSPGSYLFGWGSTSGSGTLSNAGFFIDAVTDALFNAASTNVSTAANAISGGAMPATLGTLTANSSITNVPIYIFLV
jgi:hypothetical protein